MCLSGKTTGLDSLRLSRGQILWGTYHKKNVDYVYLLWEDLVYQVENKNLKKNNDMCYPRFTKVIIDYFMSKDQSISKRNKMFWHTIEDDPMFNKIRVISRHQDTQIYDAILPAALTNQEMIDSIAYKEYYNVASRAEPPKAKTKYKKKDDEFVTSRKSTTAFASKGTRLKYEAKVDKPDRKKQPTKKTKAKGLAVLSEVALTEANWLPKEARQTFTYHKQVAQVSELTLSQRFLMSKRLSIQMKKLTFGTDEETGTIPGVPDVPPYESESDKESWGDSEDEDDDDDVHNDDGDNDDNDQTKYEEEDVDEGVRTPSSDEFTNEEKLDDEETMEDKEDDEVLKELYEDVNVNLEKGNAKMTDANQSVSKQQDVSQESGFEQEEDAHVTLTLVFDVQKADEPVQSSSVSFDFTSKFLNLKNPSLVENEIASLMETSAPHAIVIPEITSGFTTTPPP
nr:hypothetical protein [Tanacetum cinerariifolium]